MQLDLAEIKAAKIRMTKFTQESMEKELREAAEKGTGRYRKLVESWPSINSL